MKNIRFSEFNLATARKGGFIVSMSKKTPMVRVDYVYVENGHELYNHLFIRTKAKTFSGLSRAVNKKSGTKHNIVRAQRTLIKDSI